MLLTEFSVYYVVTGLLKLPLFSIPSLYRKLVVPCVHVVHVQINIRFGVSDFLVQHIWLCTYFLKFSNLCTEAEGCFCRFGVGIKQLMSLRKVECLFEKKVRCRILIIETQEFGVVWSTVSRSM